MTHRHYRTQESGFSLIELSVATAILSMGLSALSMLMLAAIGGTGEAQHRTFAAAQAASLAEMIAMNPDAAGHYANPAPVRPGACLEQMCNAAEMAAENLQFWQSQVLDGLPGGQGLVCFDSTADDGDLSDPACDGAGGLVIKVFWQARLHPEDEATGPQRMVARLPW